MRISTEIIDILKAGGVGVIPTDTIYGIVGLALKKSTVERIYRLRRRNKKKPMIMLIGSLNQLRLFNISPTNRTLQQLKRLWPGKVSIVLPYNSRKFVYLRRGTKTLAFRLPKPYWLRKLLANTGPLVAPSANLEGAPPARTIREARRYFGKKIDFYVDAGHRVSRPSVLISIKNGREIILRK